MEVQFKQSLFGTLKVNTVRSQISFCTNREHTKKKLHNLQPFLPLTCANSRAVAAIVVSNMG